MANSDEQLLAVLAKLEECRVALAASGSLESAQLVSVAILDIRMKFNRIDDAELQALCEEMLPDDVPAERPRLAKPASATRRRPLLRVVK